MADSRNSYSIELHGSIPIVRFTAGHSLRKNDIIDAFQDEILIDSEFTMDDIWDLRGCAVDPSFSFEDILEIKAHIMRFDQNGREGRKTALVVDSDAAFGMARMFQTATDQLPAYIRIFREETDALRWVEGSDY